MHESKSSNLFKAAILGIMLGMIIIIGLLLTMTFTEPHTTYKIPTDKGNYYTNNYETKEGFVTLTDYYNEDLIPPFHKHFSEPMVLQGNVQIITKKN